jgi:hypothetical protein
VYQIRWPVHVAARGRVAITGRGSDTFSTLRQTETGMLENITHEAFEALIGQTVELEAGDIAFPAEVASVRVLKQSPGAQRQAFSVELQSHAAKNHGQQIYRLSHDDLGVLDLFMVPIGAGEKGIRYEIVFN